MNKQKLGLIILGIVSIVLTILIFNTIKNKQFSEKTQEEKIKYLINIDQKSEEFMNNYFQEIKELNESDDDKENILIVISEKKIKDGYGASKIIEAPNNQYILQYKSDEEKNSALNKFNSDRSIVSAEENIIYYLDEGEEDENTLTESIYNSWGIEKMGLDKAINFIEAKDSIEEIVVAIIDTGLDCELFNENYDNKIKETYNLFDDKAMYDNHGHGTHIAGTIAEGTPKNVKIIPIKISDSGTLDTIKIVSAINWISENNRADIINMSFGAYAKSTAMEQAIISAKEKNIISVAAAGNDSTDTPHYPSALDSTISIASVDNKLNKSAFSNYGSTITFAVPGTDIKSINGNKSGTSMAAPHAVNAVSIIKSLNKHLSLEKVVEKLKESSIDLGATGRDAIYGEGFIDFDVVEFCDGNACDDENVFVKRYREGDIVKIEIPEKYTPYRYNYGNITNLMSAKIHLYTDSVNYYVNYLSDLDDIEITNYDPFKYEEQTVIVNYLGLSTSFTVDNRNNTNFGYEYNSISSDALTINKFLYDEEYFPPKIYIPETIDGKNVSSIAGDSFKSAPIESVIMFDNIKQIGMSAFESNSKLKNIHLSNNLTSISFSAFEYSGLKSIYIPASVSFIGYNAFWDTNSLDFIEVDSNNKTYDDRDGSNVIFEKETNKLLAVSNNTKTIPDTVEEIYTGLFRGTSITEIEIPKSVKNIQIGSFKNCYYLENVDLNAANLEKISDSTFENDINLKHIELSDTVKIIGKYAFQNAGLTSINIPSSVEELKENSFYNCKNLEEVILNDGLQIINNYAFAYNSSLKKVDIPGSVKTIGSNSFANCKNLSEVVLHEGLESIGDSAFSANGEWNTLGVDHDNSASKIESITIPSTVKTIGTHAFLYNKKLKKLILNEGLETIGNLAFEDTRITSVEFPKTLKSIGSDAFAYSRLESIDIPENVEDIGTNAFGFNKDKSNINTIKSIVVDKNNMFYESANNTSLIEKATKKLMLSIDGIIPNNIEIIDSYALSFMKDAPEEIIFPESVKQMNKNSIYANDIHKITLPKGLNVIDEKAISVAPVKDLTIWVYADTPAEQYAKNSGYNYRVLGSKSLVNATITVADNLIYNGKAVNPFEIKDENSTLILDTDYKIDNLDYNAGTHSVTIEGMGEYSGSTVEKTYTINKAKLVATLKDFTVEYGSDYPTFNGDLEQYLKINGKIENEEPKFTGTIEIDANANADVGNYSIKPTSEIKLIDNGNFKASNYELEVINGKFTITPFDITGGQITLERDIYEKTGSQIKPEIKEIVVNNKILSVTKADYNITYGDNINGSGTVSISGKGNYTGTITKEFIIEEAENLTFREGLELLEKGNSKYINRVEENETISHLNLKMGKKEIKYYDGPVEITDLTTKTKTGLKVLIGDEEYILVMPGDINKDGIIDVFDLVRMLNYIADAKELEDLDLIATDMTGNEVVDIFDLMRLLNYIVDRD